jgi:hypothetical protein
MGTKIPWSDDLGSHQGTFRPFPLTNRFWTTPKAKQSEYVQIWTKLTFKGGFL